MWVQPKRAEEKTTTNITGGVGFRKKSEIKSKLQDGGWWEQRLVPFSLWWGDMFVWSQTVGASAPNPVQRRLKITRGTTAQHAIQWRRKRKTGGEDRNKKKTRKNNEQRKTFENKVQLDSENHSVSPTTKPWLAGFSKNGYVLMSWRWSMIQTCWVVAVATDGKLSTLQLLPKSPAMFSRSDFKAIKWIQ